MAKRSVLKWQAGLNATFYDDKLNACTSMFGKGSIYIYIFVVHLFVLYRECCCPVVLLMLLRKLYDMFSTDCK